MKAQMIKDLQTLGLPTGRAKVESEADRYNFDIYRGRVLLIEELMELDPRLDRDLLTTQMNTLGNSWGFNFRFSVKAVLELTKK